MKIYYLLFLLTGISLSCTQVFAQWEDMNTGLSMDINGVNFDGDVGFVSGKDGIYFTQTGGVGPSSWQRYTISTSTIDSMVYERTQFNHCFSTNTTANDPVFFCGQDTVLNQAVIFSINPTNLNYSIVYTGITGSSLSHISFTSYGGTRYFAVGDNGLIVSFLSDGTVNTPTFPFTDSLIALNIYGNRYAITAGNKLFHGTLSTTGILTNLFDCSFSNTWINDLQAYSSQALKAIGSSYMNASVSCQLYEYSNLLYDEHPLNGNAIIKKGNDWIIGTDHGVYKEVNNSVEYQPSSNLNSVIDFGENAANTSYLYAACENGILLRTFNNGGPTKPNLKVSVAGSCFGQGSVISSQLGSAQSSTVTWWIDGALQTNSTIYGTGILPIGEHVISLTANNGTFYDSTSTIFYVVDTPNVSIPFTIIDDFLCHKEPLIVEFTATEDSIRYVYHNAITNAILGETDELDGGFLSFMSDSISISQPIIIEAESLYANCKKRFSDTIQLVVEHPKAFFHVNLINANPNEQIAFYNQSLEATNFDWTFYGDAAITSSTDNDVLNSYTTTGSDSVRLSAWTDNFCYDSITLMSANIFTNPTEEDSCWLNKHYSDYNSSNSWGMMQEVTIEPSSTGYFAMGNYKNGILGSQHGVFDTLQLNGAYFAKYDENGTLKWKIKTPASSFDQSLAFYEAIENSNGEVYISGITGDSFIDNEGDTTHLLTYLGGTATLIKLDAKGKLLWYRKVSKQSKTWSLGLDQNENVFLIVNNGSSYDYLSWYLNGNSMEDIDLPVYPNKAEFCLFKLNPQGDEIWHLPIANYINNQMDFLRVCTDSLNNIYLAGQMDSKIRVFNPGSLTTYNEECASSCSGDRFFYFKLDQNGNYIWSMRALNTPFYAAPSDIEVTKDGYSYLTGTMYGSMIMENADNSTYTVNSGGTIFIIKISPDGMTKWIKSNTSGYYGGGNNFDLVGDTLFVNCYTMAQSAPTINTSFINNDGTSINLTIFKQDRILAVMDTSGYMHRLITNGDNYGNPYTLQQSSNSQYFRLPNGKNFLSKSIKLTPYMDTIYFDDFGEELFWGQIPNFQQELGVVNAFYESCDNVFYPSFVSNENHLVCQGSSYNFPSGIELISQDTSYQEVFTSSGGLDSTITHLISVLPTDSVLIVTNSCWNTIYEFPDGSNEYLLNDTLQTSMLISGQGCDSIVKTHVVIQLQDTLMVTEARCLGDTFTFPDGTSLVVEVDTLQESTLQDYYGCDSIIKTQLIILNNAATVFNAGGGVLETNAGGLDYQWLNCITGSLIAGENSFQYQYLENGEYAAIVTENGCTDTSFCINVIDLGLNETLINNLEISPNPTSGVIELNWNTMLEQVNVRIYNPLGQQIYKEEMLNTKAHSIQLLGESGVYFIELSIDGYSIRRAIVKL